MPHLLAIVPYYIPFPGGAELSTHERLRRLARAGFSVEVLIAPMPHHLAGQLATPTSVDGVGIARPKIQQHFFTLLQDRIMAVDLIFYSRANLLRVLYDTAIDVSLWPVRHKLVYFVHDLDPRDYYSGRIIVANSNKTLEAMPKDPECHTGLLKPLVTVPVPPQYSRRFVTMVNPTYVKGGDVFLELAKALPAVPFLAQLGSGNPVPGLSSNRSISIQRPVTDMLEVYARTSILLVPSRREPFGRVAVEGALAGCLVLVHRIDGLTEVPLPEWSFMDTLDVDDWAMRISGLLNEDDRAIQERRQETIEISKTYDPGWDSFASSLDHLLSEASRGPHRHTATASLTGGSHIREVSAIFLDYLPERVRQRPYLLPKISGRYKFIVINSESRAWVVEIRHNSFSVQECDEDADCTLTISAADLIRVVRGESCLEYLSSRWGRMHITGDATALARLSVLFR